MRNMRLDEKANYGGKADIFDRKADIELAPITVFIGSM
jgi:hypothetical protein